MKHHFHLCLFFSLVLAHSARTAELDGDDFSPLFNGRDLTGWAPVNVAPNTFTVRDGMIVSTGKPTGIMRTDRQYENFIMEVEWRHIQSRGNAGIFIWSEPMTAPGTPFAKSIEVQVLDVAAGNAEGTATGHGDVFAIHGARMTPDRPHPRGWERCLPSEHRANPAGQWNHYRIEARDGRLRLAVNGKVVSGGSDCTPRKGYICLESEGSECHFRNLRIKELPSSKPPSGEVASIAQSGWQSLYTGIDLSGWNVDEQIRRNWQVKDWTLECDGEGTSSLVTQTQWDDFELQIDWRLLDRSATASISLRSDDAQVPLTTDSKALGPNNWNRSVIHVRGESLRVVHNYAEPITRSLPRDAANRGSVALNVSGGTVQFASIFVRPLTD